MPGAARPGGLLARFRGQGMRTGGQSVPPDGVHLPPELSTYRGPALIHSVQGGVILWIRGQGVRTGGQSVPLYGFFICCLSGILIEWSHGRKEHESTGGVTTLCRQ